MKMIEFEPRAYKCILKDVYLDGVFGHGILEKIGPDAFKDERRFSDEDSKIKVGTDVIFRQECLHSFTISNETYYIVNDTDLAKFERSESKN
jgi:hypothetical protein